MLKEQGWCLLPKEYRNYLIHYTYTIYYCFYLIISLFRNEVVNVSLFNKPEWLALKNPLTKVPILELNGKLVFESLITVEFLEEAYPSSRPLYSSDPFQRARDRIFVELFNKVICTSMYIL